MDGNVGGNESGGAGLSIKVTWGSAGERASASARGQEGPESVQPRKLGARVCQNPATCSLFPPMKMLKYE